VFLTTYICTNNLFLLFDNTTGMTHLKVISQVTSMVILALNRWTYEVPIEEARYARRRNP